MVEFALWFIIILFLLQLSVLFYLLTAKRKRISIEEEVNAGYQKWYIPFSSYTTGSEQEVPDPDLYGSTRVLVIEKILNHLIDHSNRKIDKRKLTHAAHLHLSRSYRLYLKKGSWSQRVNTLYFIEEFHMEDLKDDIWDLFSKSQHYDEEYRQSLRSLAVFGEERLVDVLLQDSRLSQRMIKELLRRFPSSIIEQLKSEMDQSKSRLPHSLQLAVISYCGEKKDVASLPFIEKRLSLPNKEIRLKALRAIAEIGSCSDEELLLDFFQSSHWEERMLAAKAAGSLGLSEFEMYLNDLAGDREWWVRFAALEALRQLPEGASLLKEVSEHHEDRYARDMASRLLTMEVS